MSTKEIKTIEPIQCRAARGLLGWFQEELALKIRGSKKTIVDFEKGKRTLRTRTMEDIIAAFLSAGIEFESNDQFCGVKIRRKNTTLPNFTPKK